MSIEERKLAAIVFTDIVGFTELMNRDEAKAMALLEQQGKVKDAISAYESLMELWKDGDERLPKRKDAINRLAKLKKAS